MADTSLIPARFLCLISHLVITITILWSRRFYPFAQYCIERVGMVMRSHFGSLLGTCEVTGMCCIVSALGVVPQGLNETIMEGNVKSCLPVSYTESEYSAVDTGLLVGLVLMLVFLAVEIVGFVSGVSMFIYPAALLSTAAHASASVALSFFLFEQWPCYVFWWIFSFCSVIPGIMEIILLIGILGLKKVK